MTIFGKDLLSIKHITHKHLELMCTYYNNLLELTDRTSIGRIEWIDIKGDEGVYSPHLYSVCNKTGGVRYSDMNRLTMRQTIKTIDLCLDARLIKKA